MDFWPAVSKSYSKNAISADAKKNKATSREAGKWTNYSVVNHGGLTAATLTKDGDSFRWRFVQNKQKSRLRHIGGIAKIFPLTRAQSISNAEIGLRQRAEQGAQYLRTYHPDIDIPFDLIKNELEFDDEFRESRNAFDPYQGNTLLSMGYSENDKRKKGFLLAFPMGEVGNDLNVSPVQIRNYSLVFQPRSTPAWSFDTPICQVTTSSPANRLVPRTGHHLAVRTYGKVTVFDVKSQFTSPSALTGHSVQLSEIFIVEPSNLNDERAMDMFLSTSTPADLYIATDQGVVWHCTQKAEHKIINSVYKHPKDDRRDFWRICTDYTMHGGFLATTNFVKRFDTRLSASSVDLLTYNDKTNVITSVCPSDLDHIFCVGTTSEVLWIDDRFPLHPLLGWKHHRRFDRTLSVQSVALNDTSVTFLGSLHNNIVSAIAVHKLADGPMQVDMPSQALPQIMSGNAVGRTIISHPGIKGFSDSFSVFEMCDQGSLHHAEFQYSHITIPEADQETEPEIEPLFKCQWSAEMSALDKISKALKPNCGKLSGREFFQLNLSELYERLFGEDAERMRTEIEERNPDAVYELLDRMPSFSQHYEDADNHMHTLFDVAFGSEEDPFHEARADFLTGSSLESARGYRARRRNRLPVDDVGNKVAWHTNIQDALRKIAPDEFEYFSCDIEAEKLDPYEIERDEENPAADHRETVARERLALDLAFSMDVFSTTAIRSTSSQQDAATTRETEAEQEPSAMLSRATEQMSLSQKEPPQVSFSYFRPINKDSRDYYKKRMPEPEPPTEEEGKEAEMPLGVRLLLSEWTVGDDPYKYRYVDPYDLDGTEAQQQFFSQLQAERQGRLRRQRDAPRDVEGGTQQQPTQSQAPPTIVAAKTLASTQPAKGPAVVRSKTQTQTAYSFSQQTEVIGPPSSQPLMTNTQVLPGPFGGRASTAVKKKPAKKRIGGF